MCIVNDMGVYGVVHLIKVHNIRSCSEEGMVRNGMHMGMVHYILVHYSALYLRYTGMVWVRYTAY